MGAGEDPSTRSTTVITNRGILITMAVLIVVGTLAGLAAQGTAFSVGVFFGGLIGLVNYFWLDRVTKRIFSGDADRSAPALAMQYVLRYVMIGALLLLVYETGVIPVVAVIAGLGAFAMAVVIQGFRTIFASPT